MVNVYQVTVLDLTLEAIVCIGNMVTPTTTTHIHISFQLFLSVVNIQHTDGNILDHGLTKKNKKLNKID